MLEYLQDRTEASYLVTDLARRIIEEESDVLTKLRYIRRTVACAKDAVAVEDAQQLRLLMLSVDSAKYQTIGVASKRMNMPDRIRRLETRLIARGKPSSNGKIICAEMKSASSTPPRAADWTEVGRLPNPAL